MDALNITWQEITDFLGQNHVPEIFLVLIGVMVIALAALYVKDDESGYYKVFYAVSFIIAAITVVLVASKALPIETGPMVVLLIGCFTLLSRPFRDSHIAIFLGLFVLAVAYVALGNVDNVDFLKEFWPRFIIALVIAGVVYFVSSFVEEVVTLFGKLVNWWPMMIVVGLLCLIEAALIYTGNGSIVTWILRAFGM